MARKRRGARSVSPKKSGGRRASVKRPKAPPRSHGVKRALSRTGQLNYERHWIPGFAMRHAQRTGVMLSEAQVRRSKEFQNAVRVLASRGKRSKAAGAPLARALETLGIREPDFKGRVGTSPNGGVRLPKRPRGRMRYGVREHGRRNTP